MWHVKRSYADKARTVAADQQLAAAPLCSSQPICDCDSGYGNRCTPHLHQEARLVAQLLLKLVRVLAAQVDQTTAGSQVSSCAMLNVKAVHWTRPHASHPGEHSRHRRRCCTNAHVKQWRPRATATAH